MPSSIGRRATSVREISLDDELTLFDTATGTALALNRTARSIWQRADGLTSVEDLVAELADHYGVAATDIHHEIVTAVRAMTEAGVLLPPP